jgi:hypothetical protein
MNKQIEISLSRENDWQSGKLLEVILSFFFPTLHDEINCGTEQSEIFF